MHHGNILALPSRGKAESPPRNPRACGLRGNFHAFVLHRVHNVEALVVQFTLNAFLVVAEWASPFLVLGILLDGLNRPQRCAVARDEVLEADREEVALLGSEVSVLSVNDLLQEFDHVGEAFRLLRNSRHEDLLLHLTTQI